MNLKRTPGLAVTALILGAISAAPLAAAPINQTLTGTLTAESGVGSVVLQALLLTATSNVTVYTTSYGGGTNLNGSTTPAGGFQPNITLYDSTGFTIANQTASFSPIANPDPTNGWKGDGYLVDSNLVAGTYYVTLTDFQNQESITATNLNLNNPSLSFNGPGGTNFTDVMGNNRTGNYALDISINPVSSGIGGGGGGSAVPEPSTLSLILPAFAGAYIWWRKRRSSLS
jgi:hypothetical protein